MATIPLSIANGSYESRSKPWSQQRCINWYPSYTENESLTKAVVFGAPGTDLLVNTGDVEFNRGAHVMAKVPYFVNGTTLYRLDRSFDANQNEVFNTVAIGTIPGSGFVSMDDNGIELCIVVPGVTGFVYNNQSDVFEEITDPGFTANGKSRGVVVLDGFFVHFSGKKIFHSEVNNALSYNSLDVGAAQADTDDIVALINYKNQLFALGSETIEVFGNVAKFPFTFQRIPGYFVAQGCDAQFSVVKYNKKMAFLGGSTNQKTGVFVGSGQRFERVSTTAIEQQIQASTSQEIADAFCWSYSEDGAIFLGVTVGDNTFVYDEKASKLAGRLIWHERRSTRPQLNNTQTRYRVNSLVQAYERILVGDVFSGKIGSLSLDSYEEYGNFIKRQVTMKPITSEGETIFQDYLELTMESGVANDVDNVISLDWTDNGKVFENPITADIGIQGDFELRQYWRQLGSAPRYRTYRITYTGRDKSALYKAEIEGDTSG